MHKYYIATILLGLFFILTVPAQDDKKEKEEKWDVSNPNGKFNYQEHTFTTDQGTWMNLDVSPDGKIIVFDLLGDIYSMPISGGKATVLRTGIPFEIQPRFSNDGKKISFTSDAGGTKFWWVKINTTPHFHGTKTLRVLCVRDVGAI